MGDVVFSNSNVSNNYKWYKHSTSITSTSSTVQIPEDDVKYGIICRGGGDSVNFFPKSLLDSLGDTLSDTSVGFTNTQIYDSGGYKYYRQVGVQLTKNTSGKYVVSTPSAGFQGCFADATYSRPTSGWYITVYYA